jgi:hypothetical protein
MKSIKIFIEKHEVVISLRDTETARAVWDACPFESRAALWGKEVYFDTTIDVEKEKDAKQIIKKGEIAFWVEGQSIAIGFGPTPISEGEEIKLVTTANIFGDSSYELSKLSDVDAGALVRVEKIIN